MSYIIFNEFLYKQIDDLPKGTPLGPCSDKCFPLLLWKKWLEQCPEEYNRFIVEDM